MKDDPIDTSLGKLLDAERSAAPPPEALGRVWSRIAIGVPIAIPRAAGSPRSWLASHASAGVAVAFGLGAVSGAGAYAALQKAPAERVVYVERFAIPTLPIAEAPEQRPAPVSPPPVDIIVPSVSPSAHAAISAPSTLAAERALLDEARRALASGDGSRALVLVDDHAHRFPRAQLSEEREALAVQALVATGQFDAARARAARFKAEAPDSLFMPAIDASLASIP